MAGRERRTERATECPRLCVSHFHVYVHTTRAALYVGHEIGSGLGLLDSVYIGLCVMSLVSVVGVMHAVGALNVMNFVVLLACPVLA